MTRPAIAPTAGAAGAASRAAAPRSDARGSAPPAPVPRSPSPAAAGRWLTLERFSGRSWVAQFETPTRAGGRYAANVTLPGLYRVRYAGEPGPPVRVTRRRG